MLTKLAQFSLEMNRIMAGPTGVKVGNWIMRVFKVSIWGMAFAFGITLAILNSDSRLLYNTTWSVDKGLYHIDQTKRHSFQRGEMVAFTYVAPEWVRKRKWTHIAEVVPMIKPIAAVPGDRVFVQDDWVWVCKRGETACNAVSWRTPSDRYGAAWPELDVPSVIPPDHYLTLAPFVASFDSRYWGLVPVSAIRGKATPVWTRGLGPERENLSMLNVGDLPPLPIPTAPPKKSIFDFESATEGAFASKQ